MMKKIIISLLLLNSFPMESNAAFNGLSIHSRANCVSFNESITWDARWYRTYATVSDHFYKNKIIHEIKLPWEFTWRSAAYHINEGYGDWHVIGSHWMIDDHTGKSFFLGATDVVDCSIYNGWWDRK